MKYLKVYKTFESTEELKKYSLIFNNRYRFDVESALKKAGIKFEESDSALLYYQVKSHKCEYFAWAKDSATLSKIIPVQDLLISKA